MFVF
jgi:uncharacterized small protein (DUF1192 family)